MSYALMKQYEGRATCKYQHFKVRAPSQDLMTRKRNAMGDEGLHSPKAVCKICLQEHNLTVLETGMSSKQRYDRVTSLRRGQEQPLP